MKENSRTDRPTPADLTATEPDAAAGWLLLARRQRHCAV